MRETEQLVKLRGRVCDDDDCVRDVYGFFGVRSDPAYIEVLFRLYLYVRARV